MAELERHRALRQAAREDHTVPEPTDLELISLHTLALFAHDGAGRITGSNEPNSMPAPRLYLGRSRGGNVWRFRADVPEEVATTLDAILQDEPPADDLSAPPAGLARLTATLATVLPVTSVSSGPAWLLPGDEAPTGYTVTSRLTPTQVDAGGDLFASSVAPELPYAAILEDGAIAALCSCSRLTPDVAEAGLVTLPAFRGRGYGPAVTAAWAAAVRATGRLPLYSTSWENSASRRVAAKLGGRLYGADFSMT